MKKALLLALVGALTIAAPCFPAGTKKSKKEITFELNSIGDAKIALNKIIDNGCIFDNTIQDQVLDQINAIFAPFLLIELKKKTDFNLKKSFLLTVDPKNGKFVLKRRKKNFYRYNK